MSVARAVERFREAAAAKGDFGASPDEDARLADAMTRAVVELHELGAVGRDAFRGLLRDPSPHVRSWVAAHLLSQGDDEAEKVLKKIARGGGVLAFDAKTTCESGGRVAYVRRSAYNSAMQRTTTRAVALSVEGSRLMRRGSWPLIARSRYPDLP